jgi:hypothetical protein
VLLGGFVEHAPERVTGPAAIRGKVAVDLAAPEVDASAIGGSLTLRADDVSLSGWDLERAVREELRESLGKLADVAALLDPGARKLLAEETAEAGEATRRLLEAVAADADFDALPWTLEDVALRAGQVSARGRGSFDPVAGGLDLEMTALLDAELTERYTARYAPLRSLVDEEGRLTMPMRIGGTLVAPSLSLDLEAVASSSLDADKGEDAVEDLLEGILRRKILKKDD